MQMPNGIAELIMEVTAAGYDVTISLRLRDDGKEGSVRMPNHWARRLGLSDDQIEELRNKQRT